MIGAGEAIAMMVTARLGVCMPPQALKYACRPSLLFLLIPFDFSLYSSSSTTFGAGHSPLS